MLECNTKINNAYVVKEEPTSNVTNYIYKPNYSSPNDYYRYEYVENTSSNPLFMTIPDEYYPTGTTIQAATKEGDTVLLSNDTNNEYENPTPIASYGSIDSFAGSDYGIYLTMFYTNDTGNSSIRSNNIKTGTAGVAEIGSDLATRGSKSIYIKSPQSSASSIEISGHIRTFSYETESDSTTGDTWLYGNKFIGGTASLGLSGSYENGCFTIWGFNNPIFGVSYSWIWKIHLEWIHYWGEKVIYDDGSYSYMQHQEQRSSDGNYVPLSTGCNYIAITTNNEILKTYQTSNEINVVKTKITDEEIELEN